jgi:hypothetical protein
VKRCALALLLVFATAAPAGAQQGFTGEYDLELRLSDDIGRTINDAAAEFNFLIRPIARSRLRKVNTPYPSLIVVEAADALAISYDPNRPIVMPPDGTPIQWQREDGELLSVWARRAGDTLLQHFTAPDGARRNEIRRSAAGDTLYLNVTITSPRLKRPMSYRLIYLRRTQ